MKKHNNAKKVSFFLSEKSRIEISEEQSNRIEYKNIVELCLCKYALPFIQDKAYNHT